jgi:hypothetical protein
LRFSNSADDKFVSGEEGRNCEAELLKKIVISPFTCLEK